MRKRFLYVALSEDAKDTMRFYINGLLARFGLEAETM